MSRIAVLSDIHGNLPALEAVVADIATEHVDEVLVGGDLVGRGPQGSGVIARVRELGWPSVRGNHEEYLLTFRRGEIPADWLEAEEWSASRWMADELGEEDISYIEALPFSLNSSLAPQILVVHASPRGTNDGIGPWTSPRRTARHLESIDESVLVCCHTHRPLLHRFETGLVVNVGAVGLPFNADRRAQYAIFEVADEEVEVEFRQVDYDLDEILAIYESSGFLQEGGVTARLLRLELENAQPFLVPFLQWAATLGIPAEADRIDAFLEFYDPREPFHAFFHRLARLSGEDAMPWRSHER